MIFAGAHNFTPFQLKSGICRGGVTKERSFSLDVLLRLAKPGDGLLAARFEAVVFLREIFACYSEALLSCCRFRFGLPSVG